MKIPGKNFHGHRRPPISQRGPQPCCPYHAAGGDILRTCVEPAPQPEPVCQCGVAKSRHTHDEGHSFSEWHEETQPEPTPRTDKGRGLCHAEGHQGIGPHEIDWNFCLDWKPIRAEQPSPPAGARESAEEFFNSLPEETKYKWAGEVKPHWAFEFAEAYAKKERERADAAERERDEFGTTIVRLDRALEFRQKECESLRTELRDMREALNDGTAVALLLRSFADLKEAVDKPTAKKMGEFLRKAEALLSRKGEGS